MKYLNCEILIFFRYFSIWKEYIQNIKNVRELYRYATNCSKVPEYFKPCFVEISIKNTFGLTKNFCNKKSYPFGNFRWQRNFQWEKTIICGNSNRNISETFRINWIIRSMPIITFRNSTNFGILFFVYNFSKSKIQGPQQQLQNCLSNFGAF